MAGLWLAAVVVVSVQANALHNNNFEIFRTAWGNLVAGRDLYAANPSHHDFFKYSPTFALLFAPFAMVPFGVGMVFWNAVNAGALYWGLGQVLEPRPALAARARRQPPPERLCRHGSLCGGLHSYTSRKRRTSRMLIMFMTSVARNSVAPTAKIVLYSMLPVGTSPIATWAT